MLSTKKRITRPREDTLMSGTVQTILYVLRYHVLQIYIYPAAVIYILHNIIYYYIGHILCTAVDASGLRQITVYPLATIVIVLHNIIINILCIYSSKVTICILIHRRMTVWQVYNVQTVRCVFVVSQLSWAYA